MRRRIRKAGWERSHAGLRRHGRVKLARPANLAWINNGSANGAVTGLHARVLGRPAQEPQEPCGDRGPLEGNSSPPGTASASSLRRENWVDRQDRLPPRSHVEGARSACVQRNDDCCDNDRCGRNEPSLFLRQGNDRGIVPAGFYFLASALPAMFNIAARRRSLTSLSFSWPRPSLEGGRRARVLRTGWPKRDLPCHLEIPCRAGRRPGARQ